MAHFFLQDLKLEETIKYWLEDSLFYVVQKTQDLHRELNEKFDETQRTYRQYRRPSICRRRAPRKTLAHTRKDFHEELGLMFQVKAHAAKALISCQHIHVHICKEKYKF
jgi:hypothetical protein